MPIVCRQKQTLTVYKHGWGEGGGTLIIRKIANLTNLSNKHAAWTGYYFFLKGKIFPKIKNCV